MRRPIRIRMPAPLLRGPRVMQPPSSSDSPPAADTAVSAAWPPLLEVRRGEPGPIGRGGGVRAIERQHAKHRLTARERIAALIDPGSELLELGRFAAWKMYEEWGSAPSASVICGIARVAG